MKFIFVGFVSAFFGISAYAGDQAYIQANMGSVSSGLSNCATSWRVNNNNYIFDGQQGRSSPNCDVKGPAGKLLAGYKITPNFAIEAGYWNLGKEYSHDPVGEMRTKLSALSLGIAVHFGFTDRWSAIGRLGMARIKSKNSDSINGIAGTYPSVNLGSDHNTKYYAGVGVAYALTPNFKLHGDFDYTKTKTDVGYNGFRVDEHGISLLSAGASVNF